MFSAMFSSLGSGLFDGFVVGIGGGILLSPVAMAIDVIRYYFSKKSNSEESIRIKELMYGI